MLPETTDSPSPHVDSTTIASADPEIGSHVNITLEEKAPTILWTITVIPPSSWGIRFRWR